MIDLATEAARVEEYRLVWVAERVKLNRVLAECKAAKHTPPSDYWKPEYRARNDYLTAVEVLNALVEVTR